MNDEKGIDEFITLQICANCTYFFPEGHIISDDTFGFCLKAYDDSLKPYVDDIINGEIPDECRELLEKYKVLGGDSCEEFESSFGEDTLEDLPTPKTYEEVISLIADSGK